MPSLKQLLFPAAVIAVMGLIATAFVLGGRNKEREVVFVPFPVTQPGQGFRSRGFEVETLFNLPLEAQPLKECEKSYPQGSGPVLIFEEVPGSGKASREQLVVEAVIGNQVQFKDVGKAAIPGQYIVRRHADGMGVQLLAVVMGVDETGVSIAPLSPENCEDGAPAPQSSPQAKHIEAESERNSAFFFSETFFHRLLFPPVGYFLLE